MSDFFSGGFGSIGGVAASAISAAMNYAYAKKLMDRQYKYQIRGLKESPGASRVGYENAGYNPLLALGSSNSGVSAVSSSGIGTDIGSDVEQLTNSAVSAMQSKAQIKNTQAQTSLAEQQAETEKAKRVQMAFQNSMTDVETHLKQKDLDTYDRRFYTEQYERMQHAENLRINSALAQFNAETNRMNANANLENARTNRDSSPWRTGVDVARKFKNWNPKPKRPPNKSNLDYWNDFQRSSYSRR